MTPPFENVAFKQMMPRLLLALLVCVLAALPARAEEQPVAAATVQETASPERLELKTVPSRTAFREHAPLALFSLGSLAVGGVFYGIHSSLDYPGGGQKMSGNGSRWELAIGAAGLTALAAGASYLYYTFRGEPAQAWVPDVAGASVDGGVDAEGAVSATLTWPLADLVD